MPHDETKSCLNCFWAWKPDKHLRCTRLPPSPLAMDAAIDIAIANATRFVRCPIQGCGEWTEIPIKEVDESMRM